MATKTRMARTRSLMVYVSEKASTTEVRFQNSDYAEKPEDRGLDRTVVLHEDDWREMGRPTTITVTIEPGDKLNEEE